LGAQDVCRQQLVEAKMINASRVTFALLAISFARLVAAQVPDPLPSWNDGPHKTAIVDFVAKTTTEGSADFVPVEERIATFDNDGTLWCEQPLYVQLVFAIDRIKTLGPNHPIWKTEEPFKSILSGDVRAALAGGEKTAAELLVPSHAGMTTDEFDKTVRDWIVTARHPRFNRPYTECVYQPMLEVLSFLRAHGFKTFVVSGGGIDFMRPWTEAAYGIPPEQIVGSMGKVKYEVRDGNPVIVKLPQIDFIDDGPGKPAGIQKFIGRRPILAFGNSDGDFEMLEWTTVGERTPPRLRLGLLVHHTDAEREFAYDRESFIGRLARGLDEAPKRGWIVVDMKADWKVIFPKP
jgi:phosphoglycolate phosphatase-like HAD superfamily hydrolase